MMKHTVFTFALLFAFVGSVRAQVSVEVQMGQDQFLPGESIPVKTRIVNNSGQTLQFGKEAWLSFSVEARDGFIVVKTGNPPVPHDFDVKASEWAASRADVGPYFTITKAGRYSVTATVTITNWGQSVSSPPKYFDIVPGTKVWEQQFGVPESPTNHSPEVRKYILQQATFSKRMKMYLRLTDASETRTYKLIPVGAMISFSDPQTFVDQMSFLHLLYQENAHIYSYNVFNPDGELTVRQTYQYVNSAPKLKVDAGGNPRIVGGVRHPAATDFPPRKAALTNDTSFPAP